MDTTASAPPLEAATTAAPRRVYRHRLPVRLMHWINVVCLVVLLGSGLNIFNAHPALYWGHDSSGKPWLSMRGENTTAGPIGKTRLGGTDFDTTGVLGLSEVNGRPTARAFPSWATIPGPQWLAMARRWHLFFAWLFVVNGVAYLLYTIFSRHLARDLVPTRFELRNVGRSILDHIKLKHPTGDAARRYNVLQKLAYLGVITLIVLMVLTGLTMSPGFNAVFPWLLDLFGGRQSARSIHFISACLIVLFVIVHLVEVVLAGPINEIRSMLTGDYRIPKDHHLKDEA